MKPDKTEQYGAKDNMTLRKVVVGLWTHEANQQDKFNNL